MVAIGTLLLIVFMSLLVSRIATVALMFTGLSKESARFQARSAFTGAGFTTSESELIVQHPVRRRIIMMLMFLGNAGLITVIATLMTGFIVIDSGETRTAPAAMESAPIVPADGDAAAIRAPESRFWKELLLGSSPTQRVASRALVLAIGLLSISVFSRSKWVDRQLFKIISWALVKFTSLEAHDYHGILHLSEGFSVTELEIGSDHWVTGKNLAELRLSAEGIQVLGVLRSDKTYIGSPTGHTYLRNGDTLILYGKGEHVNELKYRLKGEEGETEHERRIEIYAVEFKDERDDERTTERD